MKTLTLVFALAFALSTLNASAQNPGARRGQHEQESPEKIASHLMAKFDANKDGELSQEELTPAVEYIRQHHRGGAAHEGAGQGGSATAGERQTPPPADKAAAHMIEKHAADKKGLTTSELAQVIAEHRANHGGHPGGAGAGSIQ